MYFSYAMLASCKRVCFGWSWCWSWQTLLHFTNVRKTGASKRVAVQVSPFWFSEHLSKYANLGGSLNCSKPKPSKAGVWQCMEVLISSSKHFHEPLSLQDPTTRAGLPDLNGPHLMAPKTMKIMTEKQSPEHVVRWPKQAQTRVVEMKKRMP